MKYFFDTEFLEGTQKIFFGETKPTIDLISIGIVSEDDREYYAVSKDFNLKEAWNRFELKTDMNQQEKIFGKERRTVKEYWVRDNVLLPIYQECSPTMKSQFDFSYSGMRSILKMIGKSNKQIAEEIILFCRPKSEKAKSYGVDFVIEPVDFPVFYAYFADYDWVVFCWLFGKMIDLPKGFPMYCIDLKQMLDEKANKLTSGELSKLVYDDTVTHNVYSTYDTGVLKCTKTDLLKNALKYPKQTNEHNALVDAKWNYELYKFLNILNN